mgnify:CR=1 FL=1
MIILVQRVSEAKVIIEDKLYSSIDTGALIFLGIHTKDTKKDAEYLAKKLSLLRIFSDNNGRMNKSISEINGGMLIVSQFTLCADIKKGNRPSFLNAAHPELAKKIYNYFIDLLKISHDNVETGKFGANMNIQLINDGPVTLFLES